MCSEARISTVSPWVNATPTWPSSVAIAPSSLLVRTTSISELAGTIRGRCVSVCGQIGVRINDGTAGLMIGPPAESEYAVEPVGVLTIRPSPRRFVTNCP